MDDRIDDYIIKENISNGFEFGDTELEFDIPLEFNIPLEIR